MLDNMRFTGAVSPRDNLQAQAGALLFMDIVVRDGRINKGNGRGERRSSGNTVTRLMFQKGDTQSVKRPCKGPCGRTQDAEKSQKGRMGCRGSVGSGRSGFESGFILPCKVR